MGAQPGAPEEDFPRLSWITAPQRCFFASNPATSSLLAGSPGCASDGQTRLGRYCPSLMLLTRETGTDPHHWLTEASNGSSACSPEDFTAAGSRVCSHQLPKFSSCRIQRDPAAASPPRPHRGHERRCESSQLSASVNPQHNPAVPAAATFPRISRSVLPLSRLPSSCLQPDSCVSLGTPRVRNLLQWWHRAQASESSFTHGRDLGEEPWCPHGSPGRSEASQEEQG